jgi:hypothetical protein
MTGDTMMGGVGGHGERVKGSILNARNSTT